jgi:hypothetical protein
MIVEPAPTTPRGPLRRALRVAGVVAPLVLLGSIVGLGVLGPKQEPARPTPSGAVDAASPGASSASPARAVASPGVPDGPAPAFPTVAADLAVRSVAAAQARLARADGRPIAVAGWLEDMRAPDACPGATGDTRGTLSPLCERHARLVVAGPGAADPGAHLHVSFPPGVRLPPALEDRAPNAPMAVVIAGRAAVPAAACTATGRGCAEQLTADRVMWADGAPFDPGPVFDAGLEVPPPEIALRRLPVAETLATGWSGTILVAAVVRRATVEAIDPVAAAAMAAGPATGLVWYVRGLETAYDPVNHPLGRAPPRLSWAVVDEETGATLARGADDPAGFPPLVAGLPVRTVAAALAARPAGTGSRATPAGQPVVDTIAVAGWLRAWADPSRCTAAIPGLQAGGCGRTGLLVGNPWQDGPGAAGADLGPTIRATVPPGVAIPDRAVGLDDDEIGPPPPVVVLGRFDVTGGFVVERVAWASGASIAPGRQVAAGVVAAPDDPAGSATSDAVRSALGGSAVVLRMVLAPAGRLGALDAAAAGAIADLGAGAPDAATPAWYLRGLDTSTGAIRWAVVEPGTDRVIASATAD